MGKKCEEEIVFVEFIESRKVRRNKLDVCLFYKTKYIKYHQVKLNYCVQIFLFSIESGEILGDYARRRLG